MDWSQIPPVVPVGLFLLGAVSFLLAVTVTQEARTPWARRAAGGLLTFIIVCLIIATVQTQW